MSARRGGIPGPESRVGLARPAMSEAEFERRQAQALALVPAPVEVAEPSALESEPTTAVEPEPVARSTTPSPSSTRAKRGKVSRPRRVQRMFALEEDLDKKLWLYAIHVGKDRSEVVNDLLRPLVASMVLYDSRDRRAARAAEPGPDAEGEPTA